MTVYVDAAVHAWRGKRWCHLFSADLEELHRFAGRLGLRRVWFQDPPDATWPHYDVTASRRADALRLGAVEADRRTTVLVSREAMLSWCRAHQPDLIEWATIRLDDIRRRLAG